MSKVSKTVTKIVSPTPSQAIFDSDSDTEEPEIKVVKTKSKGQAKGQPKVEVEVEAKSKSKEQSKKQPEVEVNEEDEEESEPEVKVSKSKTKSTSVSLDNALSSILELVLKTVENDKKHTKAFSSEDFKEKIRTSLTSLVPKTKKARDPNVPKRPPTSYFLFCNEKRESVKKKNPALKNTDISKELGKAWTSLSEKEKKKYSDLALKEKEKYDVKMEELGLGKHKKKLGPKRNLNAYMHFSNEMRESTKEENPEMSATEIMAELGRMWKEDYSEDKAREKWVKKAEKDKERYTKEHADWVKDHPEEVETAKKAKNEKKSKKGKKEKSKSKSSSKKDKTPAKSSSKEIEHTTIQKYKDFADFATKMREKVTKENPEWKSSKIALELKAMYDKHVKESNKGSNEEEEEEDD
jgi:hypothetical protein